MQSRKKINMKKFLKFMCFATALSATSSVKAQDAKITLQATVGGICKLLSIKSSTGSLARSGDFSNSIMKFNSAEEFVQAATSTVIYSSVENTSCTYTLKTQNGGMKLGSSLRHYTARILPNFGVSPDLTTDGTANASISLTTGPNPLPQDLRVIITFSAAPSDFIPSQGSYEDVLTLSVTGGV